uniref:T-cell surface antigen CD2 n=1 Tax=Jaculus jaculus TaxID=51337 RepID=UPI001E1B2EF9|nr:T-cell surface antigen CD2 [Jaculus jaculus]
MALKLRRLDGGSPDGRWNMESPRTLKMSLTCQVTASFLLIFSLSTKEMVSTPKFSWNCSNATLTCEVMKGAALELTLHQNGKRLTSSQQKVIRHRWINVNDPFKCTATNSVSKEYNTTTVSCPERGLKIYLIAGTCAGGLLLLVFVALLIVCISKRKKQNRPRDGEELEIKAFRTTPGEKRPKPHQIPAAASQNPAAPQAPPPPGHCPQVPPGRGPLPRSHRVQHPQRRRPPPPGTQVYQQKGPPLPRPRAQPNPPCDAAEDAPPPSPN